MRAVIEVLVQKVSLGMTVHRRRRRLEQHWFAVFYDWKHVADTDLLMVLVDADRFEIMLEACLRLAPPGSEARKAAVEIASELHMRTREKMAL